MLQKRSDFKLVDKGKWDLTGGHQVFGQSIEQTAEIELMEEMGVRSDLTLIRTGLKKGERESEFYNLYYTVNDGPFKFDPHEVAEIKAFDCEKILSDAYPEYEFLSYVKERVAETKEIWQSLSNKQ